MSRRIERLLLGSSRGQEISLARRALRDEETAALAEAEAELRRYERAMNSIRGVPHIVMGETPEGILHRVPLEEVAGGHGHATGATGVGKSFVLASMIDQLVEHQLRGEKIAIFVLAVQGFLVDLVLGALGARLMRATPSVREQVLRGLTVMRFFRGGFLTPWQMLAPDASVPPLVQAAAYAEVIEQILGARMGSRQETTLTNLLALAISRGLTLLELRAALSTPEALSTLAAPLESPSLRAYFRERFPRESIASVDGLRSRLDLLLRDEALQAVLAGPEPLNWRRTFEPGAITLIDVGGARLSFEGAQTIAALALQTLGFQVFDPGRSREAFAVIIGDELQQAFTPATNRVVDRLLTTARAHRAGLWTLHQALVQLPRELQELYAANARFRMLFRATRDEVRSQPDLLPALREDAGTEREAQEERLNHITRLPPRTMIFTDRASEWGPRELVAPPFRTTPLGELPPDLLARLERGSHGVPRAELVRRSREQEAAAFARFERARTPETPDLTRRPRRKL